MTNKPCEDKETTFYAELEMSVGLDTRDNRGKRHKLPIVLLGVTLSLLSNRDGNLSSMHRHMKNHYKRTCDFVGIKTYKVVSRAQLPLVLSSVNISLYESLLFKHYGITLSEAEKEWFSGDGKELRGTIEQGAKRGEVIVQLVSHKTHQIAAQGYYNGKKESEKPAIRDLLKQSGMLNQKITLDALHFNPATLSSIHQAQGIYIVGLKENQKELLADMTKATGYLPPLFAYKTLQKGHGRIDSRQYTLFNVKQEYFDERWEQTGLSTLIKVERQRFDTKSRNESKEISFYMLNQVPDSPNLAQQYYNAIRHHWSVEVTNHVRDVTLKEDKLRTKKTIVLRQLQ